jgi:hypothetical protein
MPKDDDKSTRLTREAGPFRAKTCYVQQVDRVKIKVELGFNISVTNEFKLKGFDIPLDQKKHLFSCLVILIGGHSLVLDEVEKPYHGVHPARFYIPCESVPEGVPSKKVHDKLYVCMAGFLSWCMDKDEGKLIPENVKREYINLARGG